MIKVHYRIRIKLANTPNAQEQHELDLKPECDLKRFFRFTFWRVLSRKWREFWQSLETLCDLKLV